MKTPEEIKKGLECTAGMCDGYNCDECPRKVYDFVELFNSRLQKDALAYIDQLETIYRQLSKALCDKENATLDEILQTVNQLKSRVAQQKAKKNNPARWEWYEEPFTSLFPDPDYGWRCSHCKEDAEEMIRRTFPTSDVVFDNIEIPPKFDYCPNCGAKMKNAKEE